MRLLKYLQLTVVTISLGLTFVACSKDPSSNNNNQTADSATLLTIKWKVIKDSVSNVGNYYFTQGGINYFPNPGVYTGTAADYWDFHSTGSVEVHENNQTYTSTYHLYPNNKLVVSDMQVHDTGRVVLLTATDAVFDWSRTSPNSGTFYKRVYLRK